MIISFLVQAEYFKIFIFFIISWMIGSVILLLSFLFIKQQGYFAKLVPYECGFDPFGDARSLFNVHFYLVGILFLIFDLELLFLFPWAVSLGKTGWLGFWSMVIFLGVLTLGFIYEWRKGALTWS